MSISAIGIVVKLLDIKPKFPKEVDEINEIMFYDNSPYHEWIDGIIEDINGEFGVSLEVEDITNYEECESLEKSNNKPWKHVIAICPEDKSVCIDMWGNNVIGQKMNSKPLKIPAQSERDAIDEFLKRMDLKPEHYPFELITVIRGG
jgi:hypothetical protein